MVLRQHDFNIPFVCGCRNIGEALRRVAEGLLSPFFNRSAFVEPCCFSTMTFGRAMLYTLFFLVVLGSFVNKACRSCPVIHLMTGAAMLRTKGEAGTGDVVEAVRHARSVNSSIKQICCMDKTQLYSYAKSVGAPIEYVLSTLHGLHYWFLCCLCPLLVC